jgi:hypothetical protein
MATIFMAGMMACRGRERSGQPVDRPQWPCQLMTFRPVLTADVEPMLLTEVGHGRKDG